MTAQNIENTKIVALIILLAALSRIIPHPTNVAPLAGMTIFGAYYFKKHGQALGIILVSWWLSDLLLNNTIYKAFYPSFTWVSSSFITVALAIITIHFTSKTVLKNNTAASLILVSLLASGIFYVFTNFGAYVDLYPQTPTGLLAAYTAGLPFLGYTIAGDLVYTFALFGIYQWVLAKTKVTLA